MEKIIQISIAAVIPDLGSPVEEIVYGLGESGSLYKMQEVGKKQDKEVIMRNAWVKVIDSSNSRH